MSHKIYVASSWRNSYQQSVVFALREAGHEVYDFRNPAPGDTGFSWSQIDPNWKDWSVAQYREALKHPIAEAGFDRDMGAMRWATACVLVLPCGRSAHTEMGWFTRDPDKLALIYTPDPIEPELMYKQADGVYGQIEEVLEHLTR